MKSAQTTLLGLDWFYDILDFDLKKQLDYLTGLELILSCTGIELNKIDYLTGLGLILSCTGIELNKIDYLTGLGLILSCTGIELNKIIKQRCH